MMGWIGLPLTMTTDELAALKRAAEVLDDNGREILAEQLWYVHDTEMEKSSEIRQ